MNDGRETRAGGPEGGSCSGASDRAQDWDSEGGQKAGRAGAEKLFLTHNNMLNDCSNGVYERGCMSDRGRGGGLDGL